MIALPPIQFDRVSGALDGANLWKRTAAPALTAGSKISSHFSYRGYIGGANLLRKTLPEPNFAIKLNSDSRFEFPGSHKAIAIESSSQNFAKLANNAEVNGFEAMKCAIGAPRGTARLSGTEHEALSIAGAANSGGGSDRNHTVSRNFPDQTPLQLIVYDPRSNRLETVTELSILDRIKVSTHVGYNVFGTASAFWQNWISAPNANAARRMQ